MHSGNWYLDNTTALYQIAIEGEGDIEDLLQDSPLIWDRPQEEYGMLSVRGAMETSKTEKGLVIKRYTLARIDQAEDTKIECVGYKNFAMMALLRVIQTGFESRPMSEEFLEQLKYEHFFRKYDFVWNEGFEDLEYAIRCFEQEAIDIMDRATVRQLF